jgi:hypothetical protein
MTDEIQQHQMFTFHGAPDVERYPPGQLIDINSVPTLGRSDLLVANFEKIPDGVVTFDIEGGTVVFCNHTQMIAMLNTEF